MSDLFWILYLAELAQSLHVALIFFVTFAAVVLIAFGMGERMLNARTVVKVAVSLFALFLVALAIPSKNTILIGVGGVYVAELAQTAGLDETALKVKRLLDQKLDEALEEGE